MKSKIKNILSISLAVLFLLSATVPAVNAYSDSGQLPPHASFSASTISGKVPLTVTFTDHSTGAPFSSKYWSFSDWGPTYYVGSNTAIHTFFAAGTYPVTLIVSNSAGWSAISHNIYVSRS